MYYTINVSKSGAFYFNTGDSFKYRTEAFDAYNELKSKFPEEDGYKVSVMKYETTCAEVDFKVVSYNPDGDGFATQGSSSSNLNICQLTK